MAKVIRPGGMFFEDDVKIIDAELDVPLNFPKPLPIFSRDELQILYNGHVYVASKTPSDDRRIKVYTCVFGLEETESPKTQEDQYFSANSSLLDKIKSDFVERVVNGVTDISSARVRASAGSQLGKELADRIVSIYEKMIRPDSQVSTGKGLIAKLNDGSVFNTDMKGCEQVLVLDRKLYDLVTISQYLSIFETSIAPAFYKELQKASETLTPEEISKMMTKNKDKIHRKVLPMLRNKIWHSDKSGELFLDGTYFLPQFRQGYNELVESYQKLFERKLKIDAARSIKW